MPIEPASAKCRRILMDRCYMREAPDSLISFGTKMTLMQPDRGRPEVRQSRHHDLSGAGYAALSAAVGMSFETPRRGANLFGHALCRYRVILQPPALSKLQPGFVSQQSGRAIS